MQTMVSQFMCEGNGDDTWVVILDGNGYTIGVAKTTMVILVMVLQLIQQHLLKMKLHQMVILLIFGYNITMVTKQVTLRTKDGTTCLSRRYIITH